MTVVDLRLYSDPRYVPLVILVDPQREYQAEGRALRLPAAEAAISNCRRALAFSREHGFPIAVTRWCQKGKFLSDPEGFAGWLDGFQPRGSDMVFEKSMPSCYSNRDFAGMMEDGGGAFAVMMGFSGALACLSTVVEAYHRGHHLTFLSDASASHTLPGWPEQDTNRIVTSIIGLYAHVATVDAWMEAQTERQRTTGRSSYG
jgi:nicotinamidase-related amidase